MSTATNPLRTILKVKPEAWRVARVPFFAALCLCGGINTSFAECNSAIAANIVADQYAVHPDNTVTDRVTGLVWMRCSVGFTWVEAQGSCVEQEGVRQLFTWAEALEYAAVKEKEEGRPWRLPNSKELESLVKRNCFDPALEASVFSGAEVGSHWSSTAASGYSGSAWAVDLGWGSHLTTPVDMAFMVRLVRDAD